MSVHSSALVQQSTVTSRSVAYILRAVNIRIARSIWFITHVCSRKPIRISAGMIGATITASIARRSSNVRGDDPPYIRRQAGIGIVIVYADFPWRRVACHVCVYKGQYWFCRRLVRSPDVGWTKKASFFAGVKVKFHCVFRGEFGGSQDTQCLEDNHNSWTIVIRAWSSCCGRASSWIKVGSHDDKTRARTRDAGDDARLRIGVGELRDDDRRIRWCDRLDLVEEPSAGLGAIRGAIVTIEEARPTYLDVHHRREQKGWLTRKASSASSEDQQLWLCWSGRWLPFDDWLS